MPTPTPTPTPKARAVEYWNASLRAIQLEHVYTVCFAESARGRALGRDKAVRAEVELLKAKYLGYSFDALDRFALCHGDFHPGLGVGLGRGGRVGHGDSSTPA